MNGLDSNTVKTFAAHAAALEACGASIARWQAPGRQAGLALPIAFTGRGHV